MEAAEEKILIRVNAKVDLTGATAILKVQGPDETTPRDLSLTVSSPPNEKTATRLTLATDFPVQGNYHIQLQATYPDSKVSLSALKLLHVGGSLDVGLC